jgi:hypothetical protein
LDRRNPTEEYVAGLTVHCSIAFTTIMPRMTPDGGGGKKKLGKNLNKLVKPAAPPITQSAPGNQRNGLLLLSAQKKSNGGLLSAKPSTSATTTAPTHSTKPYEATTVSTHDALLSAVTGKSERDANHAPDAWGVAAAEKSQQQQQQSMETTTAPETNAPKEATRESEEPPWGEYGGRSSSNAQQNLRPEYQQQVDYMSRLARERAAQARAQEEERTMLQKERAAARLRELDEIRSNSHVDDKPMTRTLWEPNQRPDGLAVAPATLLPAVSKQNSPPQIDMQMSAYEGQVIHLSSYEDRDRGERQNTDAPRMLYDPKSGSMVAVKEREAGGGVKDRKKVRGGKPVKARKERAPTKGSAETGGSNGNPNKTLKAKIPEVDSISLLNGTGRRSRLPRTCGVLYDRDETGQFRSVDGCDGDLGYGAHSVPGGRSLNPKAYEEFLALQEELAQNGNAADEFSGAYGLYSRVESKARYSTGGVLSLQTGFVTNEPEEEPHLEPMEWVKGDDKLELVTGLDDSPTLKPTAKAWAPSQAAIAAAAAAAAQKRVALIKTDEILNDPFVEEDDSEEEDNGSFGLGFDPAQNMSGLMQSPPSAAGDSARLVASVDLNSLTLEPPMFGVETNSADTSGPGHIFSFGSSSTWGAKAGTTSSNGDWGMSGAEGGFFGGVEGAFGSGRSTALPKPFISLQTSNSTWGSPVGLGGLALKAEHKASTGD